MYPAVSSLRLSTYDIQFPYVHNTYMKSTLTLTNVVNKQVAFKLKATNPNVFLVKPSVGIIDKGQSINIDLTLHPKAFEKGIDSFNEKLLLLVLQVNENQSLEQTFRDSTIKPEQQKLNITILGSSKQTAIGRSQKQNSAMFESIHNETFTTPTQSKLSTSTSSIPLDKLQKDVQRKEEQYRVILQETQQFQTQKSQIHDQKKKGSMIGKLVRFIFLFLIGYLLTVFGSGYLSNQTISYWNGGSPQIKITQSDITADKLN